MGLAAVLAERKEQLIRAWRERVAGALAPAAVPSPEILDSLPVFIDELVASLRERGDLADLRPRSRVARDHGEQRFRSGFDLRSVVREYGILRECIIDLVDDTRGDGITLDEDRILTRVISAAIADGVDEYSRQRDAELQRHAAEHFAFLAHELRNPLSSARLAFELMTGPAPSRRHADTVERGLARLQRLLDEALVEARLRLGSATIARERVRLDLLVAEVASESEVDAESKRLSLALEVEDGVELEGDPRLLRSVVSNLVRNAVKFSRHGGTVRVAARRKEGRIVLEVEDACGGLPDGTVEELFLPFAQNGSDRSGFGLGLAITKQAVDAHGGVVQVHSIPGRGCVFLVGLPPRQPEAPA